MSDLQYAGRYQCLPIRCSGPLIRLQNERPIYIHVLLTSALVGVERSPSRPCRFTPEERALGTHWTGSWVGPRTGLNDVEKRKMTLPGLELLPLVHPARSLSLYRLRYPGSCTGASSNYNIRTSKKKLLTFKSPCTYSLLNPTGLNIKKDKIPFHPYFKVNCRIYDPKYILTKTDLNPLLFMLSFI
jgi:hypothetical protein